MKIELIPVWKDENGNRFAEPMFRLVVSPPDALLSVSTFELLLEKARERAAEDDEP